MFVVLSYGFAVFAAFAPRTMANLGVHMNARGMTAHAYYRLYRRDPSYQNLYLALNRMVLANRHRQVITYAPQLFESDEYDTIITTINGLMSTAAQNLGDIMYSAVVNEHDRLRTAYLRAHVMRGNYVNALEVFHHDMDMFHDVFRMAEYYVNNPLTTTIPPQTMEVIRSTLGRPSTAFFEMEQLLTRRGFLAFLIPHQSAIYGEFRTAYIRNFERLLHRVQGYNPNDSRIRVARGFVALMKMENMI